MERTSLCPPDNGGGALYHKLNGVSCFHKLLYSFSLRNWSNEHLLEKIGSGTIVGFLTAHKNFFGYF